MGNQKSRAPVQWEQVPKRWGTIVSLRGLMLLVTEIGMRHGELRSMV